VRNKVYYFYVVQYIRKHQTHPIHKRLIFILCEVDKCVRDDCIPYVYFISLFNGYVVYGIVVSGWKIGRSQILRFAINKEKKCNTIWGRWKPNVNYIMQRRCCFLNDFTCDVNERDEWDAIRTKLNERGENGHKRSVDSKR
jgi:hypothetical protein